MKQKIMYNISPNRRLEILYENKWFWIDQLWIRTFDVDIENKTTSNEYYKKCGLPRIYIKHKH